MFPVIFSLGSFNFYTLDFTTAVGFLLASFLSWRRLRNLGLAEDKIIDLLVLIGFWGFVFSRLSYLLENFADFGFFIDRWLLVTRYPGLTLWGAVLGFVFAAVRFSRKNNQIFVKSWISYAYPLCLMQQNMTISKLLRK